MWICGFQQSDTLEIEKTKKDRYNAIGPLSAVAWEQQHGRGCCVIKSIIAAEWLCVAPPLHWGADVRRGLWTSAASHSFHLSEFENNRRPAAPGRGSMRHHCALKHGIVKEFLAEFLGTFVLVVSRFLFNFLWVCLAAEVALSPEFCHLKVMITAGYSYWSFSFSLPVVRLRLRRPDGPQQEHPGRAPDRAHRLLGGTDDGCVRCWWSLRSDQPTL